MAPPPPPPHVLGIPVDHLTLSVDDFHFSHHEEETDPLALHHRTIALAVATARSHLVARLRIGDAVVPLARLRATTLRALDISVCHNPDDRGAFLHILEVVRPFAGTSLQVLRLQHAWLPLASFCGRPSRRRCVTADGIDRPVHAALLDWRDDDGATAVDVGDADTSVRGGERRNKLCAAFDVRRSRLTP